jgi:hypothetical protein
VARGNIARWEQHDAERLSSAAPRAVAIIASGATANAWAVSDFLPNHLEGPDQIKHIVQHIFQDFVVFHREFQKCGSQLFLSGIRIVTGDSLKDFLG